MRLHQYRGVPKHGYHVNIYPDKPRPIYIQLTHPRKPMNQPSNLLNIRNSPRKIRHMRTSHDPGFVRQQTLQLVEITDRIFRICRPPPSHLETQSLGDSNPSGRVGFMVQLGQNQFVAGVELQSRREVMEELRRRYADADLGC